MLIAGYHLVVLAMVCLISKKEWLIPVRRYIISIFLILGCGLVTVGALDVAPAVSLCFGFLTIVWFIVSIWSICHRNRERIEIIHIPQGGYEVAAVDRAEAPTVQMRFLLKYQEQIYLISTLPPEGRPALILYARRIKEEKNGIILADIAVDTKNEPKSVRQRLYQLRDVMTFLAALFLPIAYMLYKKNVMSQNLMPNCMMIVLGYWTILVLKDSKDLYGRVFYWFGRFFEAAGWIIIPINYLLRDYQ